MRPINIDYQQLNELYIIQQLSTIKISKILNCSKGCVLNNLVRLGIPIRNKNRKNRFNEKNKYTNQAFQNFKILDKATNGYNAICYCGNSFFIHNSHINRIKSCGCLHRKQYIGKLLKSVVNKYKQQAKRRQIEFCVSAEYLSNLYEKQQGLCAISKSQISLPDALNTYEHTASLDRIDSNLGYIEGNLQWIHKYIQNMKWDKNQNDFIFWCKLIAQNN